MGHKFKILPILKKIASTTALIGSITLNSANAIAKDQGGFFPLPPSYALLFKPGTSSYIQSIQTFEITIAINATSATATISSVTTGNSVIFFGGFTTTNTSTTYREILPRAELTNATTVTVYRDTASASQTVTVRGTVVEFTAGALAGTNVQTGTITVAASALTGTATISAVTTARSVVFYLGNTLSTTTTSPQVAHCRVDLTNTTTVTATRGSSSTAVLTVGYAVVEFNSSIIQSIQARAVTLTSNTASDTDTINAVTMANTLLIYNGVNSTSTSINIFLYYLQLTSTTQTTLTRIGTSSTTRTIGYTALEFVPSVLNSMQRGSISVASVASADATITAVNTSKAVCNVTHWDTDASSADERFASGKLNSSTTVRAEKNTGGTSTSVVGYEVAEFI